MVCSGNLSSILSIYNQCFLLLMLSHLPLDSIFFLAYLYWSVTSSNWVSAQPQKKKSENLKQLNATWVYTLKSAVMCLLTVMQWTMPINTLKIVWRATSPDFSLASAPPLQSLPSAYQVKCLVAAGTSRHALQNAEHRNSRMGAGCVLPDSSNSTNY